MKFGYRPLILATTAGLAISATASFAQLKIDENAPIAITAFFPEGRIVDASAQIEPPVYIPEPSVYGLWGAASLCGLLLHRRIAARSAALA